MVVVATNMPPLDEPGGALGYEHVAPTGLDLLAGCNAVSLSSFGGEGQGEEAVALDIPASWRRTPLEEKQPGPPLPNPLLPRRRGGSTGAPRRAAMPIGTPD